MKKIEVFKKENHDEVIGKDLIDEFSIRRLINFQFIALEEVRYEQFKQHARIR